MAASEKGVSFCWTETFINVLFRLIVFIRQFQQVLHQLLACEGFVERRLAPYP